jgi:hypothetical protein
MYVDNVTLSDNNAATVKSTTGLSTTAVTAHAPVQDTQFILACIYGWNLIMVPQATADRDIGDLLSSQ